MSGIHVRADLNTVPRREGQGPGISLAGRPIEVYLAVTQEDARTMAADKARAAGHDTSKDARNLYLVRYVISQCNQIVDACNLYLVR